MNGNRDMIDFAMLMVDSATQKYLDGRNKMAFVNMLIGIGKYRLESFPGAGHNYYVILEAIYEYYREHPDKHVDEILFSTLMGYINAMSSAKALPLICNYIVAQVKNENQRISRFRSQRVSPFKLDNVQLLKQMRFVVLNEPEFSNDELAVTLLDNTIKICEETMGEKVL